MKARRRWVVWCLPAGVCGAVGLLAALLGGQTLGAGNGPETNREPGLHFAFDFNDGFYRKNGIDPKKLMARKQPDGVLAVSDRSTDPTRNNTRILAVNGGFDAAGALLYYPDPPAMFFADAFLNNAAGEQARILADQFRAFIFPRRNGNPLDPAPPNRRQDNMFETTMGYVGRNPLGLWRLTFVHYTDEALQTPEGQQALSVLAARNGLDLDGTPVIRRMSELLDLERRGFVKLSVRPEDGSAGPPWVV